MALKAAVFYWNVNKKSYIRAYGGERVRRTGSKKIAISVG